MMTLTTTSIMMKTGIVIMVMMLIMTTTTTTMMTDRQRSARSCTVLAVPELRQRPAQRPLSTE